MKYSNGKFVYNLWAGKAGFYSEFNNMALCRLFCLQHDVEFRLYSRHIPFLSGRGWDYYFKPFCKEASSPLHSFVNRRSSLWNPKSGFKSAAAARLFPSGAGLHKLFSGQLLTQDLFYEARASFMPSRIISVPAMGFEGTMRDALMKVVADTYRFNERTSSAISAMISSINLPEKYVGIHVRGGDKVVEADLYSTEKYMKRAEAVTDVRNAFILTDDYRLYLKLKELYPEWSFYTLTFPDEVGFTNSVFIKKGPERIEKEMMKVFASVEVMRGAVKFIGTYSSNIGAFLGTCMTEERMECLDNDKWYFL